MDDYERVGHILSLMKSKARRSLKVRIRPASRRRQTEHKWKTRGNCLFGSERKVAANIASYRVKELIYLVSTQRQEESLGFSTLVGTVGIGISNGKARCSLV